MSRFQVRLLMGGAVLAALLMATAVYAQGPGPGPGPGRGRGGPGLGRGGPQAEFALGALNLTDAQQDQVKEIMQRHREQMQSEIEAILTPDQRDQAAKLRTDREARLKQRQQQLEQRRQQRQQRNPA